jgi:hypothetical protein
MDAEIHIAMLSAFTHSHRPEQRNLGDHDLAVIPADDTRAATQLDQKRRAWAGLLRRSEWVVASGRPDAFQRSGQRLSRRHRRLRRTRRKARSSWPLGRGLRKSDSLPKTEPLHNDKG